MVEGKFGAFIESGDSLFPSSEYFL